MKRIWKNTEMNKKLLLLILTSILTSIGIGLYFLRKTEPIHSLFLWIFTLPQQTQNLIVWTKSSWQSVLAMIGGATTAIVYAFKVARSKIQSAQNSAESTKALATDIIQQSQQQVTTLEGEIKTQTTKIISLQDEIKAANQKVIDTQTTITKQVDTINKLTNERNQTLELLQQQKTLYWPVTKGKIDADMQKLLENANIIIKEYVP